MRLRDRRSPRAVSLAAVLGIIGVLGASSAGGWSASTAARLALGAVAVGALVAWVWRCSGASGKTFKLEPRLTVVSRASLSPKSYASLIDVEGRTFLVVHGEGFAEIAATKKPAKTTSLAAPPSVQKPLALARVPRRRHLSRGLAPRRTR